MFYRVQSLGAAGLGDHVGQLRLAEGEFSDAMAKHRAKILIDFHEPEGGMPSRITPAQYFRSLVARVRSLHGGRVATQVGTLESLPGATVNVTSEILTFRWRDAEGGADRRFTLVLDFRGPGDYPIDRIRTRPPNLSDPYYDLSIDYPTQQPVIEFNGTSRTPTDEVSLYELDPRGNMNWLSDGAVKVGGVAVKGKFQLGTPLLDGEPAFIFKTPVLVHWEGPTEISGLTSAPVKLTSRFSRTYHPGHHNFIETFLYEPGLEPGIDPQVLEELRRLNVRILIVTNPTAFPEQSPTMQVYGFDGTLRTL